MIDRPPSLGELNTPLADHVRCLSARVRSHSVFGCLRTLSDVRVFMEHHVWAVWDFMSLLKSIQARIAPSIFPWAPTDDVEAARFVNEIVLGEESDEAPDGCHASHFEIYLRAMDAAGANAAPIRAMVQAVASGTPWLQALQATCALPAARAFVMGTMRVADASLPERVAAFTLGREDVIPGMFSEAVASLDRQEVRGARLRLFRWYLDRHIAVDADHHGPLAARLFKRVCLVDDATRDVSLRAAAHALERRADLWDSVTVQLHV